MASRRVLLMMAILIALVVAPTMGAKYMVGDEVGWRLGVDYSAWAEGKDFRVGDTLVFTYFPGAHNVVEVNGTEFTKCSASSAAVPFTTGGDVIHLTAPGETGYICTVGNHCSNGMKLLINVSSASAAANAPLPAPFPGSTSSSSPLKSSYVSMIAAVVMVACIMILVVLCCFFAFYCLF